MRARSSSLQSCLKSIRMVISHRLLLLPALSLTASLEFSQHGGYLSADHEMRYRLRSIESLGYNEVDSISLKKHFLRRLFRIKEQVMQESCARLSAHPGLENEYMALSVRRGDKVDASTCLLAPYLIAQLK